MLIIIAVQLKANHIDNKRYERYNKTKNQNLDDLATQEIITFQTQAPVFILVAIFVERIFVQ